MSGAFAGAPVLLTDPDERATLAAARALVAAGYRVHVAGRRRWTLAGVSRGVHPETIACDPLRDGTGYVTELADLSRRLGIRLLLPVTDGAMESILRHRERLPGTVALPVPSLGAFRSASDKAEILTRAREAGLDVPESVVIPSRGTVPTWEGITFPAVVKPHRSVVRDPASGTLRKCAVTLVDGRAQAEVALAALPAAAFPVLIQRRVHGPGEGLFLLRWEGRTVACFAHRRLREKPPGGGVSVYRESIAADPALVAASERLLEGLGWRGVAMIECKRDAETGRHVLMEINGRLWGSLQLALDAGIDFPGLLAACAFGAGFPATPPRYRVGVRCRWFWGDVDHLVLRLLRSRRSLHLAPTAPTRWQVLREFLRRGAPDESEEICRRDDPAPFILESLRRMLPLV